MYRAWLSTLSLILPSLAMAGGWETDYCEALEEAREADKPILVYFGNHETIANTAIRFLPVQRLADQFVLVHASKDTHQGRLLYRLFEVDSDNGYVVVDRSQAWQYCRFERQLDDSELETLLTKASSADGKPVGDILFSSYSTTEPARVDDCPYCNRNRGL